ncbi:MAG TPA: pectin acetylesterase-family hydrolase [Polyangia bacterium]|nr:pectin acetylesterase-family hydrolase [Polyangia bacterium]
MRSRSAVGLRALFGAALAALIPAGCGSSGGAKRDGGGTDVGTLPGGDAATGGPIVATAGTWTWIPFPDAVCADGSTTGIGVNLGAAGARPLIYLEGGGACWSEETCYTEMTAANFVSGYSAATFALESGPTGALATPGSFFDRSATANPFKDYSFVYVPYCTGDAHAGNNVVRYGTHTAHHVGFKNFAAYLNRLVPTFSGADRVILAGSSAGGYGALFNWWQAQQAFGSVRVDMVDDSGTLMPPDVDSEGSGFEALERVQWNLAATLPSACASCATDLSSIFGYYAQALPNNHAALLSYTQDSVIPIFYGITTAEFTTGLTELVSKEITPNAGFRSFLDNAAGHELWAMPALASAGVTVETFVTQMVTDDAGWMSVGP